jgi:hypothetical protein
MALVTFCDTHRCTFTRPNLNEVLVRCAELRVPPTSFCDDHGPADGGQRKGVVAPTPGGGLTKKLLAWIASNKIWDMVSDDSVWDAVADWLMSSASQSQATQFWAIATAELGDTHPALCDLRAQVSTAGEQRVCAAPPRATSWGSAKRKAGAKKFAKKKAGKKKAGKAKKKAGKAKKKAGKAKKKA